METKEFKKPNGTIITVSENSWEHAKELGWKEVKPKAKAKPRKSKD